MKKTILSIFFLCICTGTAYADTFSMSPLTSSSVDCSTFNVDSVVGTPGHYSKVWNYNSGHDIVLFSSTAWGTGPACTVYAPVPPTYPGWSITTYGTYVFVEINALDETSGACDSDYDNCHAVSADVGEQIITISAGGGGGGGEVATSTAIGNVYVFMLVSVFLFCVHLLAYLVVIMVAFMLIGWPIRYFAREIYRIIRRGGKT